MEGVRLQQIMRMEKGSRDSPMKSNITHNLYQSIVFVTNRRCIHHVDVVVVSKMFTCEGRVGKKGMFQARQGTERAEKWGS